MGLFFSPALMILITWLYMYSNLEYNGTFTTAASTSPWQLSKYFLRSYKILKIISHQVLSKIRLNCTGQHFMPTWKVISYSTNVWMATALYNFLESLWIYNAHPFVPITPLGHGHFPNRTFSVALICFFFSHRIYPIGHMLIGILTFDTRKCTSQTQLGVIQSQPCSLMSNINTTNQ